MFSPWPVGTDPLNIKIDVYGMGLDRGTHMKGDDELNVPIGVLNAVGKHFEIRTEELIKIYCKGLLEGLKNSKKR